jgi:hypothetical protein
MNISIFTHYMGNISIKSLRDYILDAGITDADTILLNRFDFDKIVLDYREVYKEGIDIPYLLLGVLIKEDDTNTVPENRIKIVQNDTESLRSTEEEEPNLNEPIYRCGYCGDVVDFDGRQLSHEMRNYYIGVLEKYPREVFIKRVNGYCCKNR